MSMRVRIHRGSHEIGGNCVEVESGGARIVLDLGRPLDAGPDDDVPLPPISGLDGNDPSLLGVLISHPHQDHYGLASGISEKVPIFTGEAASNILRQAAFFGIGGLTATPTGLLRDRVLFETRPVPHHTLPGRPQRVRFLLAADRGWWTASVLHG